MVLLPVRVLSNDLTAHNAFMTVPSKLQEQTTSSIQETAYAVLAALIVAAFVLVPARAAPALLAVVAVGLLAASGFATAEVSRLSQRERNSVFSGADPDWVDASAGGHDVAVFITGERTANDVWQHLFWNERIRRVLHQPGLPVAGPLPQAPAIANGRGVLHSNGRPIESPLVLAGQSVTMAGERIAGMPPSLDQPGSTCGASSLRPASRRGPGSAAERRHDRACHGAGLRVRPGAARAHADRQARRTAAHQSRRRPRAQADGPPGAVDHLVVPAPPDAHGDRSCVYELASDGLLGSTRIDFVRK